MGPAARAAAVVVGVEEDEAAVVVGRVGEVAAEDVLHTGIYNPRSNAPCLLAQVIYG